MAYICISGNTFFLLIFSSISFHSVTGGVSRLLTMLIGREQGEVLSSHFIQIIEICKLLSVTDELCELKQLVPLVSLQESTAARYNCDDTMIAELGQTYGHFKTECQPFFLLEEFDSVTLKAVRYH